jgi:tetratricopeptide (TPR) repeat protein
LKLTERQLGENNARTLAPLRGLGFALAGSGEHDAAIPYLERSLHITQASFGLFDLRQQDLLRQLAFSLTATWRGAEAQRYVIYRLRVAEKTYGEGDPRVLPAFCDAGDWFLDIAKFEEARSAFQVALNIVDQRLGEHDLAAVAPLRGMASTYMREQSYRAFAMALQGPPYHIEFDARGAAVRPAGPRRLNGYGERLLQRALRLLDDDPQAPRQALVDTLIQLGDWFQIKHSPTEALPYYQRAWRLIAAQQPEENAVFGFPVRVYYPAPLIVFQNLMLPADEVEVHRVHMQFTVTADGAVADARMVEHNTSRKYADDILDALRAARFRPKLVDGQPVPTPALDYTEVFRMTPQKLTSNSRRSANP